MNLKTLYYEFTAVNTEPLTQGKMLHYFVNHLRDDDLFDIEEEIRDYHWDIYSKYFTKPLNIDYNILMLNKAICDVLDIQNNE